VERLMQGGEVEIVGIAEQFKEEPPYNSGYRLAPRDAADFTFAPVPPYRTIALVLSVLIFFGILVHLWLRRRSAERRAREIAELSESLRQSEGALRERENRLRAIVEAEPECVEVVAPDGSLLEMNPAGLATIEAGSAAAVVGRSVYPLIAPEYRHAFGALLKSVCQGNKGTLEFGSVGLKGTRRWMEMHAVPLRNAEGGLNLLVVARDITERKQAEEALRQAEEKYRSIVENAVEGISQTTPEGRYLSVNSALARMYGYESPAELMASVADI
jgi:PAS domain S-box-containing protein